MLADPVLPVVAVPKQAVQFRNFVDSSNEESVCRTYRLNHTYQTLQFVKEQKKFHLKFNKGRMSLWDVFTKLESVVDESDPDNDLPQIFHAIQTAEALRQAHPSEDWLHLIGLIHDLGKLLVLEEFGNHPMWAVVGDTFPVGCAHSDKVVKSSFFSENPDSNNPQLNTECGIYEPNCGLDNLIMSWGHDEYMYQVLCHNKCTIPQVGLNIIRFHSFFVWHRDGAYSHLMKPGDEESLTWCQTFSQADLYSKGHTVPTQEQLDALMPYYRGLAKKYLSTEELEW